MKKRVSEWPGAVNDPHQIFREAVADAAAGRHKLALQKHLWFHNNALTFKAGLSGVRRSYGLSAWRKLADIYPPAMRELRKARDSARRAARIRPDVWHPFADFLSINEYLGEEIKTVQFFKWLDKNAPERAEDVYHGAEEALVRAKEFELCGRYIKGEERFMKIRKLYRVNLRLARDPEVGADYADFARKSFSEKTVRLVALLVRNRREPEAKKIVTRAKRIWPDKSFATRLTLAMRGQFDAPT